MAPDKALTRNKGNSRQGHNDHSKAQQHLARTLSLDLMLSPVGQSIEPNLARPKPLLCAVGPACHGL